MAIGAGMTSAIMNPMHPEVKAAVMAADVLTGQDKRLRRLDPRQPCARPSIQRSARRAVRRRRSEQGSDAPNRLHTHPADRPGRHRHHGARPPAPVGCRSRLGVRRSWHLRSLPGRTVDRHRSPSGRSPARPPRCRTGRRCEVDYETKGNARRPLRAGRRLGCAATVRADAVISVPSESQVHKQVGSQVDRPHRSGRSIRSSGCSTSTCRRPVLGNSESVTELIGEAVPDEHTTSRSDVEHRRCCAPRTRPLPTTHGSVDRSPSTAMDLRSPSGRASSMRRSASRIDVGSTTVAGHLCDLSTGEVVGHRRA